MRYPIGKLLAASGLAIVASPLCFTAQAQDYIDVEAERRAAEQQQSQPTSNVSVPSDPYGVKPVQSYPATSYGVNNAPAGGGFDTGAAATAASAGAAAAATQVTGSGNVGQLLMQVQQLQQEVMRLNGKVEEQAHELRTLKDQSLERYVDLDRRVSALTTGDLAGAGAAAATAAATTGAASGDAMPAPATGSANVSEQAGEGDAYRAAYALVRAQQFDQAVSAFQAFLRQYPAGRYAPNAHYWLGELYLVIKPADLEASRQAFALLLEEYPDNAKAPDAMYKLGRVHFMKGNREKAREYLDQVVRDYGSSNNSAARLAQQFIDENY